MSSSFDKSITRWIDRLKQGDEEAAGRIWKRYFERLVRVARNRLRDAPRRVTDEEDVAISAFDALCRGAAEGRFTQLANRDDLWRLLVAITAKIAVDQIRRESRVKRGGGAVRGHSVFGRPGSELPTDFDQILSDQPTPQFLVTLDERSRLLFASLRDDVLRQVARCRLEGYSNAEISQHLGISLRSVERKLKLIRDEWSRALIGADSDPIGQQFTSP